MGFRLNRPVRGATLRCRGLRLPRGRGLRKGWKGASLLLADQGQEVGLKTGAIFGGVAQQDFDQAAFACAEMPLNSPSCETVQKRDRLLNQELFEFFGGHLDAVIRKSLFVKRPDEKGPYFILAVNVQR
jgi:hypothetical protein